MTNAKVGDYINDHFTSAAQKVGTFQVVGGEKQGGNVASYFCRPDGTVLHAIPGPVDATAFLAEARFAVELHKLALLNGNKDALKQKLTIAEAHQKRVQSLSGGEKACEKLDLLTGGTDQLLLKTKNLGRTVQAHALLMAAPLAKLDVLYPIVWQNVLKEPLDVSPVAVR